jgi:hypothetical protein
MIMEGARVQNGCHKTFMKKLRHYNIVYQISEPYQHNENRVKGIIRELKKQWYQIMLFVLAPMLTSIQSELPRFGRCVYSGKMVVQTG